jgi:hypothetical protein
MPKRISIAVRSLVEFISRSGSIDNRFGNFDRAYEGAKYTGFCKRRGEPIIRPR